jgi:type IV secretory pathway VirJ component
MLARQVLQFIIMSILSMCVPVAGQALTVSGGLLGAVEVTPAVGESKGLVFLLGAKEPALAATLAADGLIVARVNTPQYLGNLRAVHSDCLYLVSDIEETSRQIQRDLGQAYYFSPWLVGADAAGSALAYGMLAQAPQATVAGAVMMVHADYIDTPLPLCPGAKATAVPVGGYRYASRAALPGRLLVAPAPPDRAASQATFLAGMPGVAARLAIASGGGAAARLHAAMVAALADTQSDGGGLSDLPLAILPATLPGPVMAVVYSGDGGWRDIDKQVATVLAAEGIPTVGVDSLRYFWNEKSPAQMARDLERIVAVYGAQWRTPHIALIGYSFGADILPFVFNELKPELQARVSVLSLLALARHANPAIAVTGWLGHGGAADWPTDAALAPIAPALIQCIRGTEDTESGCDAVARMGAQVEIIKGGHHFDGDYVALAHRIRAALDARLPANTLPSNTLPQ